MASLPCRLCGVDTHVSIGYHGTFVKCLHCRNLSRPTRPSQEGPRLDTEEGMRAFVDSILAECQEDDTITDKKKSQPQSQPKPMPKH
jgi:hypothetical protein